MQGSPRFVLVRIEVLPQVTVGEVPAVRIGAQELEEPLAALGASQGLALGDEALHV
eukprot:CAMPEP_0204551698 /NCGR_PEP_ID=MMETSP0661-20131031/26083_1 /ASSEMBLY_ACC=CAM_ASM_000606 /TAXON_ID=109239 /ORGANISM="Alexandrium margalefi, Strain AMGDE01CS-322" /LENGTH=55 /DNA_ID=CAMNT_0051558691 /DNA_START=264 /DNA_END=427 /DNA_ORIENTATION=+